MEFFTPSIENVDLIKKVLINNTKQFCEMSVANTILWSRYYHTQIAFWEGELIYRSETKNGEYSFAGNLLIASEPKRLFDRIVELANENKQALIMHCIDEKEAAMIETWYPGVYQISYNRDSSDYIYLREKLASLAGKKLHGKRNHIHRFEENNPDWAYESIHDENEEECARMAMKWCLKNCMNEEEEIEYDKIDESKLVVYAIRHRKELGMIGGALRVRGEIIAITLGEPLTADTFVVHFEKAYAEIQGAYPMINREFVKHELSGYTYVNREEDLGVEGLRKAKLSYHPEIILNKGNLRKIAV